MKRLIYLNKPLNIIVVIVTEYTKKVETSLDEAPCTPPFPKKRFALDVEKTGRTLEVLRHIK